MFRITASILICLACSGLAQLTKPSPTEKLRVSVAQWVETMQKIQQEENDWKRDKEVLQNYKDGLKNEITDLTENLASAETRKQGADKESLDKVTERDRYAGAKLELAAIVRRLEENLSARLPLFPAPLTSEPKVAQAIEDLNRSLALEGKERQSNVSKRLLNVITLVSEAEKFQQTVHIRSELHSDQSGREFNTKVIYFGLAMAYAVNDGGSLALSGRPGPDGWKFEECPRLAGEIQNLIDSTSGNQEAAFVQLPFSKP